MYARHTLNISTSSTPVTIFMPSLCRYTTPHGLYTTLLQHAHVLLTLANSELILQCSRVNSIDWTSSRYILWYLKLCANAKTTLLTVKMHVHVQ